MQIFKAFGLISCCFVLLACGGGGGSPDAPAVGKVHESAWIIRHDERAQQDLVGCQVCHGIDFNGHANASSCLDCHFGAPPFVKHPPSTVAGLPWGNPVNHGYWAKFDLFRCQGCHAGPGGPGTNPRFNRPYPGMEQGCESTEGCHGVGNSPFAPFNNGHNPRVAHPSKDPNNPTKQDRMHWYGEKVTYVDDAGQERTAFITHVNAGNVGQSCTPCHGAALEGGVGPACLNCHVTDPMQTSVGCVSCHGNPVGSTDSYRARVGRQTPLDPTFRSEVAAGFHLKHAIIPPEQRDEQSDCQFCHSNDSPTGDPADPNTNVNKHHLVIGQVIPAGTVAPFGQPGQIYFCNSCHRFELNPLTQRFELQVPRDCKECHTNLFDALPGL